MCACFFPPPFFFSFFSSPKNIDSEATGYLPNHNMDPAAITGGEFGQIWSFTTPASTVDLQEQFYAKPLVYTIVGGSGGGEEIEGRVRRRWMGVWFAFVFVVFVGSTVTQRYVKNISTFWPSFFRRVFMFKKNQYDLAYFFWRMFKTPH